MELDAALDLTVTKLADLGTAEVGARMATRWLELWLAGQPARPSVFQVRRVVNALCALQSVDHRGPATGFLRAAAGGGRLPTVSNYGF